MPLAFLGTGASIFGDVALGSGSAEKAFGEEAVGRLADATTTQAVKKVLGDKVAPELANAIVKTKDKNVVRNLLKGKSDIPTPPATVVPPVNKVAKAPDALSAAVPKGPKPPTVIARSPTESPELIDQVKRGKLQKAGDTAPINSLKLGSDVNDGYDTEQVKKYVDDIKNGHTIDPIVIDNKGFVQDGKHRLEAMRQLGVKDVPVVEQIPKPKLSGAAQQSKLSKSPGLTSLNDGQILERNYVNNIRAAQGEGANLPGKGLSTEAKNDLITKAKAGVIPPKPTLSEKLGLRPLGESGHIQVPGKAPVEPKPSQVPVSSTESVAQDPFNEITDALNGKPQLNIKGKVARKGDLIYGEQQKGIEALRREQNTILSKERGARLAASGEAGKAKSGYEGYLAEKAALKGEYSKVGYKPLVSDMGEEKANQLFAAARDKIRNTPDSIYESLGLHPGGARLNTQTAVAKVLGLEPGLPTSSEIKLLRLHSPKIADAAAEQVNAVKGWGTKLSEFASKIFGSSRAAKSTADFSMGGRQGLFVAARHPELWAKANYESVKMAKSGQYFKDAMKGISEDPWVKAAGKRDLGLTGVSGHEEMFANPDLLTGDIAKNKLKIGNIPAGADRAYTGGLTQLRADLWKTRLQAYGATPEEAAAKLGDKGMDGLAEAVRTLTGRGGKAGGFVEKHATTLNESLFSPRLWASRLEPLNPAFWNRIGPAGRKEALQSLGSFASVAGLVLSAAVAAGATVETDPRSSDFLKIKVGDTRYDILGGFQQNLVFGARQALGFANTGKRFSNKEFKTNFSLTPTTKSSQTGKLSTYGEGFGSPTQLSALYDLVRNKANPVLGSAANIIEGKDRSGNPINPLTEIGQLFVPISIQGSFQALQQNGLKGLAKNTPDLVGISTQSYGLKDLKISDKQKATIAKLTDKNQQNAYTLFYQTEKGSTPDRNVATGQIKQALTNGDIEKAKSIARDYNNKYSKAFDSWRGQYGQYKTDKTLVKEYNSNKITSDTLSRYLAEIKNGG